MEGNWHRKEVEEEGAGDRDEAEGDETQAGEADEADEEGMTDGHDDVDADHGGHHDHDDDEGDHDEDEDEDERTRGRVRVCVCVCSLGDRCEHASFIVCGRLPGSALASREPTLVRRPHVWRITRRRGASESVPELGELCACEGLRRASAGPGGYVSPATGAC